MCVIKPCANPTEVGVWWRDDTEWCQYEAANQSLIRTSIRNNLRSIDLGSIKSAVHPEGWRYTADLQKMEQVAVTTGQRRGIMIIDPPAAPPAQLTAPRPQVLAIAGTSHEKLVPIVHYKDASGQLQQFDPSIGKAVLEHLAGGEGTNLLVRDQHQDKYLLFDLQMMKQRVVLYMNEEDDEPVLSDDDPVDVIIEVPWSPSAMAAIAKKAGKDMRRKILEMVIDRYRSDKHLDAVLPAKAHPRTLVSRRIDCNTLKPGNPSFEVFVDCLEDVIGQSRHAFELLIKCTSLELPADDREGESEDGSILRLGFKPVDRAEKVKGTMARKKDAADQNSKTSLWMSMLAPAAATRALVCGYANHIQILLYFMILTPEAWRKVGAQTDCVSIENPGHHLHVGEVVVQ